MSDFNAFLIKVLHGFYKKIFFKIFLILSASPLKSHIFAIITAMKTAKIYIFCALLTPFLGGCLWINERGISDRYYNSCKEYYDATGIYRQACDKNLVDWDDLKIER